jgi:hypothetical protein
MSHREETTGLKLAWETMEYVELCKRIHDRDWCLTDTRSAPKTDLLKTKRAVRPTAELFAGSTRRVTAGSFLRRSMR